MTFDDFVAQTKERETSIREVEGSDPSYYKKFYFFEAYFLIFIFSFNRAGFYRFFALVCKA